MPNASELAFVHVFAFRWKNNVAESQQERAAQQIRAFQGVVPGLTQTFVGHNLSARGSGYTFGGVMHFSDHAAFKAYETHPAHVALLSWLVPLIEVVELDLEADVAAKNAAQRSS